MNADPVIAVAGIFEEPRVMRIARHRAAHHRHDVFVAIVIQIRERNAVAFGKYAGAG